MPTLSTHILDSAAGGPRAGLAVELRDAHGVLAGGGLSGADGRLGSLGGDLAAGTYRVSWSTGGGFLAEVSVLINLSEDRHYHVPLLVSAVSAVTYLGT